MKFEIKKSHNQNITQNRLSLSIILVESAIIVKALNKPQILRIIKKFYQIREDTNLQIRRKTFEIKLPTIQSFEVYPQQFKSNLEIQQQKPHVASPGTLKLILFDIYTLILGLDQTVYNLFMLNLIGQVLNIDFLDGYRLEQILYSMRWLYYNYFKLLLINLCKNKHFFDTSYIIYFYLNIFLGNFLNRLLRS